MDATFRKHKRIAFIAIISVISVMLILSMTAASKGPAVEVAGLGMFLTYIPDKEETIEVKKEAVEPVEQPAAEQPQPAAEPAAVNLSDYEAAILYLINTVRAGNGLEGLVANQSLTDISRTRSNDMLARGYFSHYTPEGTNVFDILRGSGISFSAAGENLAHSRPAGIGSPEAFIDAWVASPTHLANMLQSKYHIVGVGMVENGDRRVVTTVFRN